MTNLFDDADVISAYTRQDALTDGVLIDVTPTATEAGFSIPVAMTSAAWHGTVRWTDADERNKSGGTGQSEDGRLWDVLWMAHAAVRSASNQAGRTLSYQLLRVPTEGRGTQARLVTLVLRISGGDHGEPVMTITEPNED